MVLRLSYMVRLGRARVSSFRFPTTTFKGRLGIQTRSSSNAGHVDNSPTKVEKIILDDIKATGPISFARYMSLCLSHPTEGYYMNPANPVFGARGDFTTSPEISQVFGELLAIWFLSQWSNSVSSRTHTQGIRVIELGPGQGTLMDDLLRVLGRFPTSASALKSVHLVETSPTLRAVQEEKLRRFSAKAGGAGTLNVVWHDSIEEIAPSSDEYTMVVAHEFFDALPIHVLQKSNEDWREVLIASTESTGSDCPFPTPAAPRLRRVLSRTPTPYSSILGLSSPRFQKLPVESYVEVCPTTFKIARKIGELLKSDGAKNEGIGSPKGCALIIDYGNIMAHGDSFRAFKNHKLVDVFHRPGECDLTANVDFAYIKEAIGDLGTTHGPLPQSDFLNRMGLQVRVEALRRGAISEDRRGAITTAAERLVDLTEMGRQYQVLGITCKGRDSRQDEEVWPFVHESVVTADVKET